MIRTWLAVGAVLAVGVAAAADALRDRPEAPAQEEKAASTQVEAKPDLAGPDVPPPRTLSGTLTVATVDGCRILAVDLARLALGPEGGETGCGLWVSPGGEFAVVSAEGSESEVVHRITLVALGGKPVLLRDLGLAQGGVSWSGDGRLVAWCDDFVRTQVLNLRHVEPESQAGCMPWIGAGGLVLTLRGRAEILRDGRPVLRPTDLARAFPAGDERSVRVLGFAERAGGGLLGVSVAQGGEAFLELWQGAALELVAGLPLAGDVVQFSPDGNEVAIASRGEEGRIAVLDVRSGELLLPPTAAQGFSWSPDGVWLVLATPDGIPIYGPGRAAPAYVLPLPAAAVAWR